MSRLSNSVHDSVHLCFAFTNTASIAFGLFISGGYGYVGSGGGVVSED